MKIFRSLNAERGFTLVEIMAVVFIIGIMVGLAAISIGGHSERLLNSEAQRLYQKIRLTAEEAEYAKNEYGMALTSKSGYVFFQFDDQLMEWVKLDKEDFKPVEMEEDYDLELDTGDNTLDTSVLYNKPKKEAVTDYGEKSLEEPDIIFFSDGQVTPFKISISNKHLSKSTFIISADNQSELRLKRNE